MGRTPRVNKEAGRDHWSFCSSVVIAGAGVRGGQVHGASDRFAAYPAGSPVGPADIAATIFHSLGIALQGPRNRPDRASVPDLHGNTRLWALGIGSKLNGDVVVSGAWDEPDFDIVDVHHQSLIRRDRQVAGRGFLHDNGNADPHLDLARSGFLTAEPVS